MLDFVLELLVLRFQSIDLGKKLGDELVVIGFIDFGLFQQALPDVICKILWLGHIPLLAPRMGAGAASFPLQQTLQRLIIATRYNDGLHF